MRINHALLRHKSKNDLWRLVKKSKKEEMYWRYKIANLMQQYDFYFKNFVQFTKEGYCIQCNAADVEYIFG